MQSRSDHIATIVHGVIAKCLPFGPVGGGWVWPLRAVCLFFHEGYQNKKHTFIHKGQDREQINTQETAQGRQKRRRRGSWLWCTAMSGVMIYPIPSMSQCECVCLWDASQCVSYALLSSTRYKTYQRTPPPIHQPHHSVVSSPLSCYASVLYVSISAPHHVKP